MYNLFVATKHMVEFQKEYQDLFSRYSSLDQAFSQQEIENIMTLVNVWRYVLDAPIKGYAIAYDAKQKFRKGTNYFADTLSQAVGTTDSTLFVFENHAYIIGTCDVSDGNTLESDYARTVLQFRAVFKEAVPYSSDRWYVETQPLELAYIPLIAGTLFPVAFSIPFYKLLDADETKIASPLLPCEISRSLFESVGLQVEELALWESTTRNIGALRLALKQYMEVWQFLIDDMCSDGVVKYKASLFETIDKLQSEIEKCKPFADNLRKDAKVLNAELVQLVRWFFDCFDRIRECIQSNNDVTDIIEVANNVIAAMALLQSDVAKYIAQKT